MVGQIGGVTTAVVPLSDTLVLLNTGPRLVIIDLATLQSPQVVVQTNVLPTLITSVTVAGSFAYVAGAPGGLWVFDLTQPRRPIQVAAVPDPEVGAVLAAGPYLYAFGGSGPNARSSGYLSVYDLARPADPQRIHRFEIGGVGPAGEPNNANRLALAGSRLLVAAGRVGLRIVDVADPTKPQTLGTAKTPGRDPIGRDIRAAHSVAAFGNMVYVGYSRPAGSDADLYFTTGVAVVDCSDPGNPIEVGFLFPHEERNLKQTVVHGDLLVIVDQSLKLLSLADPANPSEVHREPRVIAAGLRDSRVFAVREGALEILDLADPTSPHRLGAVSTVGRVTTLAAADGRAHVAGREGSGGASAGTYRILRARHEITLSREGIGRTR
jgi:hypothetical protein